MEWDDDGLDGLDDGPTSPLLPPEDRLWRHPSEVAAHPVAPRLGPDRPPRLVTIVALSSAISILLTLATVAVVRPIRTKVAVEQVARPARAASMAATTPAGGADVAAIAERLRPSVPAVHAEGPGGRRRGSGVLYRSDGLLLTSHHVVDGARAVRVVLDDGRELEARVVGGDPDTDIAVLDVDGGQFAVAPLGSAATLKIGEPAITIGTDAGAAAAGPLVTVGVVSAIGRSVDSGGVRLLDMIQTDTGVAPGCSGGAVVDASGVVFGIATTAPAGESGYATPIDVARVVAGQLLAHGRVTRGWLGVEGDDLPVSRAKELAIPGGVVVKAVKDASPAVAAGLEPTDVIAEIDGDPVRSMTELVVSLRMRRPGDTVSLAVVRGGERRMVKVKLAAKP